MPNKMTNISSKPAKPKIDIMQQDKERLASLSGRDTVKCHIVQSEAQTVQPQIQQPTQQTAQQPAQPQIQPQVQQQVAVKQAPETVKDMSKKRKGQVLPQAPHGY